MRILDYTIKSRTNKFLNVGAQPNLIVIFKYGAYQGEFECLKPIFCDIKKNK